MWQFEANPALVKRAYELNATARGFRSVNIGRARCSGIHDAARFALFGVGGGFDAGLIERSRKFSGPTSGALRQGSYERGLLTSSFWRSILKMV